MKRRVVVQLATLVMCATPWLTAAAKDTQLNVYNWSDYIAKDTIPNFTKQSGDLDPADVARVISTAQAAREPGLDVQLGGQAIEKLPACGSKTSALSANDPFREIPPKTRTLPFERRVAVW